MIDDLNPDAPNSSANFEPNSDLAKIATKFVAKGVVQKITPLGNGNINSTFLVTTATETPAKTTAKITTESTTERFVLQRINTQVFRQPERVIQNMRVLSDHLRNCPSQHLRRWETPEILLTDQNQSYWIDEAGEYWRAIGFIERAHVLETVENVAHAQEIGYGLAMFHSLISTLPAERLADTLEGFHITPIYLAEYERVRAARSLPAELSAEQAEQVSYCLTFVEDRKGWAHVLERAKAAGHLKLRPIHGDPKVNNMMLADNGQAVSLIDLDTLKPGLVHYDIGDCLRSGCNPLGEETEDWQNVVFDTALAEAMLKGYLSLAKDFLTEQDYDYLYDAIRLIAFELGLRFLTDYLAGNVYFKVKHPTHNLMRALIQFKLTESIEQQADTLKKIIQTLR